MMIKPGITELSKCVDSRYTLVTMAAKRARMIGSERTSDEEAHDLEKPVSQAAEEIMEGKVGYVRSSGIAKAKAYEDEKQAAILSMSNAGENDEESEGGVDVVDYEDTEDSEEE